MRPRAAFPLGSAITVEALERDPHPHLAALRANEPVSWVPALGGWLVTRHDLALEVMRAPDLYTVEDERFSTARVLGPSMLSLDGEMHDRHRAPFAAPFRPREVRARFARAVREECARLLDALDATSDGAFELRGQFAGPLAAGVLTRALGLEPEEEATVRAWYGRIVNAVDVVTAGGEVPADGLEAYAALAARLGRVIAGGSPDSLLAAAAVAAAAATLGRPGGLTTAELAANAGVLLFGGIETTEAMIANAALHLLGAPEALARVREPDGQAPGDGRAVDAQARAGGRAVDAQALAACVEESLRLEPAAAMVDRYATRAVELGGAAIAAGELVHVSLSAAGRDPAVFDDPDRFVLERPAPRRHLAFAQGPHVCLGIHLARLEARTALAALLERLPRLRLDPDRPAAVSGLVFRKPSELWVRYR